MNFDTHLLIIFVHNFSFYFPCFSETVPGTLLGPLFPPTTCGVTEFPLAGCAIIQGFIAFATIMCRSFDTVEEMTEFLLCLSEVIPPQYVGVLQSLINGITDGTQLATSVCTPTLGGWASFVNSECPGTFNTVNLILSLLGFL